MLGLFLGGKWGLLEILVGWLLLGLFILLFCLMFLDFLGLLDGLGVILTGQVLRWLFILIVFCQFLYTFLIRFLPNLTEHFIIIIKDISHKLTGGNQELIFPDILDERPELDLIFFGKPLILFDLLVEFDDVGEELLDFLGAVGSAQEVEASAGGDSEFEAVFLLRVFGLHFG